MMPNSVFTTALQLRDKGKLSEAAALCWQLLQDDPHHGQTLQLLASISHLQGNTDAAIILIQQALAHHPCSPDTAEFHTNLGNLWIQKGNKAEAAQCYQQALAINPDFSVALYNSAMLATEEHRTGDAIDYYQRLITLHPEHPTAHNNLGAIYLHLGEFDETITHCKKALDLKPDYANAATNIGIALLRRSDTLSQAFPYLKRAADIYPDSVTYLGNLSLYYAYAGKREEAIATVKRAIAMQPDQNAWEVILDGIFYIDAFADIAEQITQILAAPSPLDAWLPGVYTSLAILAYQDGKFDECRHDNQQFYHRAGHVETSQIPPRSRWFYAYSHYITRLLEYHTQHPELYCQPAKTENIMYVIGESHALSPAHTCLTYQAHSYRLTPRVITGCKVWHLLDKHPLASKFMQALSAIPDNSLLLLTLGEIDCRSNEGIISYYNKHPDIDLAAHIERMTGDYIALIQSLTASKHVQLFVQGVPAPNHHPERLSSSDRELFHQIIRLWNRSLQQATKKAGMKFVDVYRLTANDEGVANTRYHLDEFHLSPHYLQELMDTL